MAKCYGLFETSYKSVKLLQAFSKKDKLVIGINNNNNNNNKEKKDVSQHEALPLSHTNVPKTQPIIKFVNYILASNP
jgi:hypothetical protein